MLGVVKVRKCRRAFIPSSSMRTKSYDSDLVGDLVGDVVVSNLDSR